MDPTDERYRFARALARDAGALALDWRSRGAALAPTLKQPGDWVTAADRDVEQFIRKQIAEHFPDDTVIGEEEGGTMSGHTWIIDPIDGTMNYLKGLPVWCVSIGYLKEGAYTIGVVEDALHATQFHAARGRGAWQDDTRLTVSEHRGLADAHLAFAHQRKRPVSLSTSVYTDLADAGVTFRALGSGVMQLTMVARGVVDGFYESLIGFWDIAAATVLIEEAGGWIKAPVDFDRPMAGFPVVAGAPGLRSELEAATRCLFD